MARISLLTLHLAAPLAYSESPGSDPAAESLLVLGEDALIVRTGDSGPQVVVPLPQPQFRGVRKGLENKAARHFTIEPGDYLFAQWRPGEYPGLEEALEDILRQIWWERRRTIGPWMVRTLEEDGQTAMQCWVKCLMELV